MRGKTQVVAVVGCLALTGCAAAMQYTVTADLFIQPSRVLQGDIFDIAGPSPAFTPPGGPSSEAPTLPGQPAEITAGRLLRRAPRLTLSRRLDPRPWGELGRTERRPEIGRASCRERVEMAVVAE